MHRWTKYSVIEGRSQEACPDHLEKMAGYNPGPEYASRQQFFDAHLFAQPRCRAFAEYLNGRIGQSDNVLAVASGRCANELYIAQEIGCRIVCSDVREWPCISATRALFPELNFRTLDVLTATAPALFDVVLALALIWAFDDNEVRRFFSFARTALKVNGRLLLELGLADGLIA